MKPLSLNVVEELDSTNEFLLNASLEEFPFGTTLLARRQSAGRGRAGRVWESTPGGLYLSALILPTSPLGLTLVGALALIRCLEDGFGLVCKLRWPNDVYLNDRKLAGVLPQVRYKGGELERAVLGIGCNVQQDIESYPEKLRNKLTTLSHHVENCPPPEVFAGQLLPYLEEELGRLESEGCASVCSRCESYLDGLGRAALVNDMEGRERRRLANIVGLSPTGELLLEDGSTLSHLAPDERHAPGPGPADG